MIEVQIKTTAPEAVAFIEMHGPYAQIPKAMEELYGWIGHHGLRPVGMPSGVYLSDPAVTGEENAEWEVHAPVAGDVVDAAPDAQHCGIKHVAPHLVASTMHKGPYDTIADTYAELGEWVTQHGYRIAGPSEELYYSDPATTKPQDYLTEVRIEVAQ